MDSKPIWTSRRVRLSYAVEGLGLSEDKDSEHSKHQEGRKVAVLGVPGNKDLTVNKNWL